MTGSNILGRASVWLAAAAALLPLSAAAQSNGTAPQSTPPVTFSLQPSTRPTPAPIPTSGPIIAPLSRPTPTPTPSILKIPPVTAGPSASASPAASGTPRVTNVRRPTVAPVVQPTPALTSQPVTATPTPDATATPVPAPVASAAPEPVATASAPVVQPASGWPTGLLIAIGAGALALVAAGGFMLGRRRGVRKEEPVEEIAPKPRAAPPEPAAPPASNITVPARRRIADEPQPRLEITLIPKRAGTNLMSAAVDYRVIVRNTGPVGARDIRFGMYMLTASARQAQDLQTIFAATVEQAMVPPFDLAPGAEVDLSGMALLAREQVNVMTIDGKPWFVPVLAMKADYRWGENVGAPGVATAAHMIGIDRGEGAKMAPFRLDGAPHMHPEVAERKVA
ncbi:hypothetical protein [Sphingomonas bacterium]|uniref:hypothetical protein n=1 Tax=Sphingomonas bacterium TaxID=1895847 RepID=UPI002616CBCB|nr:hypothetical protein [Sphingomonas bacterium]MDB5677045.1 hypothetical protein [Sphingomonas bacterium]